MEKHKPKTDYISDRQDLDKLDEYFASVEGELEKEKLENEERHQAELAEELYQEEKDDQSERLNKKERAVIMKLGATALSIYDPSVADRNLKNISNSLR